LGYWHCRGKCNAAAAQLCLTLVRALQVQNTTLGPYRGTRIGSSA
jgi:hypothetical protein